MLNFLFSKERDDIRYILFGILLYFTIHFTVFAMIDRSWGVSDIYGYLLVLAHHNQGYSQGYMRVHKDLFDKMRVGLRRYLCGINYDSGWKCRILKVKKIQSNKWNNCLRVEFLNKCKNGFIIDIMGFRLIQEYLLNDLLTCRSALW